jgi:predicted nucleic acid-binding protein
MSGGSFLDSNVLVYYLDESARAKHRVAATLVERCLMDGTGTISFQVVQEVLNTITRKFDPPFSPERSRRFLDSALVPMWRVSPSQPLYELGLDLQQRYRCSFYDSMILAAAISADCDRLYSEDLHDGQRVEGVTIVNPFA